MFHLSSKVNSAWVGDSNRGAQCPDAPVPLPISPLTILGNVYDHGTQKSGFLFSGEMSGREWNRRSVCDKHPERARRSSEFHCESVAKPACRAVVLFRECRSRQRLE